MGVKMSEWRLKLVDGVSAKLAVINGASEKAAGKFTKLQDKIAGFEKNIQSAASEVPGLNEVISMVTNPYVAVAAGVVAVGAALVTSTNMAMDFERGMAQVNVTAQLGQQELGNLKDRLLDLGSNSTVELEQIPAAFNQVISAVGDVDKSLAIFEPSLRAAKAGFTDIKVVTEAVTNVMGAVKDASPNEVFDTLFATMRVGKAEFSDIANYLPKVIPLSNNLGISFKEAGGMFAYFTSQGQSVERTTTLMENAFRALANPERIKAFKEMGVAIFDSTGKMRSMPAIAGDLAKKLNGLTDEQRIKKLASLGLDSEGASAFAIMSQDAAKLQDFINQTVNSAGAMDQAYENSLNTSDRLTIASNQFKRYMIDLGYLILPLVNSALNVVNDVLGWIKAHSAQISTVFSAIGKVLSMVLAPAILYISALWEVFKGGVQLTYSLLVGYIKSWKVAFDYIGQFIDWIWQKIGGEGSLLEKLFGGSAQIWTEIKAFLDNIRQGFGLMFEALNQTLQGNFSKAKALYDQALNPTQRVDRSQSRLLELPAVVAPTGVEVAGLKPKDPGKNQGVGADKNKKAQDGLKSVNEGGKQVRNVTVHIGNLVKEFSINAQTVKEGASQMKDIILEEMIRAIAGAEQAI